MNYTKIQHTKPYEAISPSLPQLSTASKSIFITGGSAGIGKATALAFLEAGCRRLALTGRRAAVLSSTASEISAQYPEVKLLTFAVDVTDEKGMDAAFASATAELGPLDVVVNSAGSMPPLKPLSAVDLGMWWRGFETNVKGAAVLARCVAGHAAADAVVLHLGTAGALFPANAALPMSGYAASKLASVKVMEYFGAENPGLRVVSVHPGIVTESEGGRKMVEESGMEWPGDDINLPAHFLVWAASKEADFLKNKFVFAGWDVDELKARKEEIAQSPELLLGLNGFPRSV
ncbi:NAD(P)-binding protein [Hypoxylon crocopeplum]|nr:NAD(P)-binding protein [Hypoxylon crocopeplum]